MCELGVTSLYIQTCGYTNTVFSVQDLETMSQELVRLSKLPVQCITTTSGVTNDTQSHNSHIHADNNDVITHSQTVSHSSSRDESATNHGDEAESLPLAPCNGGEET